MANYTNTSQLIELVSSQAQKEVYANANFRASSPANSFARNDIAAGANLSWPYYGGTVVLDGVATQIGAGTITNLPISKTLGTLFLEVGRVNATTTAITGFSIAAAAQITVATNSFVVGDIGYLGTAVAVPTYAQGTFFKVTAISGSGPYTLTTDIVSTGWSAWTSGGTIAKVTQNSGTITVGKASVLHSACKPLYSLSTNTTTTDNWTDLRIPGEFIFNNWGTYTPTLTNGTNIASSTPRLSTYSRIGNTVTVSGQLDVTGTATGNSIIGISLPIASTLLTAYQLGGNANAYAVVQNGGIYGQPTGTRAELRFQAIDTASNTMCFSFQYEVV